MPLIIERPVMTQDGIEMLAAKIIIMIMKTESLTQTQAKAL